MASGSSLYKSLVAKEWFRSLMTFVLSLYIRLLWLTARVEWRVAPEAAPYISGERQSIYCFWHGRLLLMPYFANTRRRPINALISQHRDGVLIAETIHWLGIKTIHGSSSKGSRGALRGMIKLARDGENLGITPDGPRGPYQEAALGTVWVAKMTGLPIMPLAFTAASRRHLKTWDRFLLPRLFSRVVMDAQAPISVPRDADEETLERYRVKIQALMRDQVAALDESLS